MELIVIGVLVFFGLMLVGICKAGFGVGKIINHKVANIKKVK